MPSSSTDEKKAKIYLAQYVFGTASTAALEKLSLDQLRNGLKRLKVILAVPENTVKSMAENKIIEPPPEDVPEFPTELDKAKEWIKSKQSGE
jgi:hypothetical protein